MVVVRLGSAAAALTKRSRAWAMECMVACSAVSSQAPMLSGMWGRACSMNAPWASNHKAVRPSYSRPRPTVPGSLARGAERYLEQRTTIVGESTDVVDGCVRCYDSKTGDGQALQSAGSASCARARPRGPHALRWRRFLEPVRVLCSIVAARALQEWLQGTRRTSTHVLAAVRQQLYIRACTLRQREGAVSSPASWRCATNAVACVFSLRGLRVRAANVWARAVSGGCGA